VHVNPSRYDSGAVGDTRTLISAEAAYQSANGGYYDKPECLVRPGDCILDYTGPSFIDASFLGPKKSHYQREFHPGLVVPADTVAATGLSPSSLEGFAWVAIPTGDAQGLRAFCSDSSGIVCATPHGGRPLVTRGACVVAPRARMGMAASIGDWLTDKLSGPPAVEPCYPL
jgi:hypothetical protein